MAAGRYDVEVANNETLTLTASVYRSGSLRDLSGYTPSMVARTSAGATGTILTATGSIATGTITMTVSETTMNGVDPGDYVYDLLLSSVGSVERILYGNLHVVQGVTR